MPRARKSNPKPEPQTIASYAYAQAGRVNLPTADNAAALIPPRRETPQTLSEQTCPPLPYHFGAQEISFPYLKWQEKTPEIGERSHGPLYVHDKVNPAEILSRLLLRPNDRQMGLFADAREAFNGFKGADGKPAANAANEPYRYQNGHWANRLIRATAQRAMRSLLHREGLAGQVHLVYLDPPYNNSFRSNFAPAANDFDSDENEKGVPNDPLAIQAYRDTYENDIHSYLDGLKEQLELAQQLLAADGSIIVQIGPDNLHYIAMLLSQVFGPKNHVATIPYRTTRMAAKRIQEVGNWLVWFAKELDSCKYRQLYLPRDTAAVIADRGGRVRYQNKDGSIRELTSQELLNPRKIAKETRSLFTTRALDSSHHSDTGRSDKFYFHPEGVPCPEHSAAWDNHICSSGCHERESQRECPLGRACDGKSDEETACPNAYSCPTNRHWSVSLKGLHSIAQQGRMLIVDSTPTFKVYESEQTGNPLTAIWDDAGSVRDKQYIVETPVKVLQRCLLMTTDPGDLVLDLTCGSGAMPYQCETWGRRWMAVDVSAVSIAIARDRILTGAYPYHLLRDSAEGHRKDHELNQAVLGTESPFQPQGVYGLDPARGFVNERQIRVSAATLAYGPQIPKDLIYHPDRTCKDPGKLRAASNFEVCSDSPYRALSPEQALAADAAEGGVSEQEIENALPRRPLELEPLQVRMAVNLTSSGISQSGRRRYQVKGLQTTDIPHLTHTGIIVADDGVEHPAGFYLGKADEIISNTETRDAAHHAGNNGFAYLGVVGFAQDGDAGKEGESFPNVTVLNIIAHRDLQLDNLKDAQRDNGFVIISEPEVILHRRGPTAAGQELVALEVVGINAFDPKRGVVDEPSARRIKAIIVDSCYDDKKFVASHYNILPTKQNRRAFKDLAAAYKGVIDDRAWRQMQTCETAPFPLPGEGYKIAVKVIDQTGTEHIKVLPDPAAAAGVAPSRRPRGQGRRPRQT